MLRSLYTIIFCLTIVLAKAQEERENRHRLTAVIGHAHVNRGLDLQDPKWLLLPSWGLDYDFWISPRVAVGLHSDIVLQNFSVESFPAREEEVLQRSFPVALIFTGLYRLDEHLSLLAGGGVEIAEEETLGLWRLGAEYGWEISELWELNVNLVYDRKPEAYDTWTLGLGVSRWFDL